MKKILLACNAGMSTSILVKRMDDYCLDNDIDVEIMAVPVGEATVMGDKWDIVLLGPQIAFNLERVRSTVKNTPVEVIPPEYYATGKGKETVEFALKIIGDK